RRPDAVAHFAKKSCLHALNIRPNENPTSHTLTPQPSGTASKAPSLASAGRQIGIRKAAGPRVKREGRLAHPSWGTNKRENPVFKAKIRGCRGEIRPKSPQMANRRRARPGGRRRRCPTDHKSLTWKDFKDSAGRR